MSIPAIDGDDRMHSVAAEQGVRAGFGQSQIPHLALINQPRHRAEGILDGDTGVDPALAIRTAQHPAFANGPRTRPDCFEDISVIVLASIPQTSRKIPQMHATGMLIPAPAFNPTTSCGEQIAVLAGGCFWGVQGVFQHVRGVLCAVVGYAGGDVENACYEAVSSGLTEHAEAVEITFDPNEISYGELLQIYFSVVHDPTQRDRQGPDRGPQYRSAIFPQTENQAHIARAYIAQLDAARIYPVPIATTIESGHIFYPAEHYHQDYMARHPCQPYIAIHDLPKVEHLKRLFPERFRAMPRLVMQEKV